MRRRLVFHPWLFAAIPVLALYVVNAEQLYWHEILGTWLFVMAVVCVVWPGLRLLLRDVDKSAWLASFFFITFFSYNRVWSTTRPVEIVIKFVVWLSLWVAVFFFTAHSKRDFRLISSLFNIVSLGWLAAILVPWGYYTAVLARDSNAPVNQYISDWQVQLHAESPVCAVGNVLSVRPDIYYIILDGYGRADILQRLYDFDNTRFMEFLKDTGFYVAEHSTSNYAQTVLSLSSSLNFQYLDDLVNQVGIETRTIMPLRAMISSSRVFEKFRQLNYVRIAFSSGYLPTEMTQADYYLTPAWQIDAFQSELINATPLPLILKPLGSSQYDSHRQRILFAFEQLPEIAKRPEPTFTFVHILAPHPPFVFGPAGETVQSDSFIPFSLFDDSFSVGGREAYIAAYRDQVTFIAQRLQATIASILAQSPQPPLIIIQGDHGPSSRLNWQNPDNSGLLERFSIFNAYYFPDHNYTAVYSDITPVNTFRVVFNQFFCGDYSRLADKSYFSPIGQSYTLTDVTDIVRPVR